MEIQRTIQSNPEKNRIRLTLPDFKVFSDPTVAQTVWFGLRIDILIKGIEASI